MGNIHVVMTTVEYKGEHWSRFCEAFAPAEIIRVRSDDEASIKEALKQADVAVLKGDLDKHFLNAPHLRWIHCDHAGLNGCAWPELFDRNLMVTSSAGRSAPVLAEHVLFFMLALVYRYPDFIDAQRAHHWGIKGQDELRGLYGRTVGIIGMGHTGMAIALRTKAMGMRVLGYRRSKGTPPPGVDRLFSEHNGDSLGELLAESDFVALALPLTNATHHLIGEKEFAMMKPGAYLINMARGAIIDDTALLDALHSGKLGGAGLDAFKQEPLPPDSPLWKAPRTLLTPHATPQVPDRTGRSLDIICDNVRRYQEDEPLINLLRPSDIYTMD